LTNIRNYLTTHSVADFNLWWSDHEFVQY